MKVRSKTAQLAKFSCKPIHSEQEARWQANQFSRTSSLSRTGRHIAPTRTAKVVTNYEQCRKQFGCTKQFRLRNPLRGEHRFLPRVGLFGCCSGFLAMNDIGLRLLQRFSGSWLP